MSKFLEPTHADAFVDWQPETDSVRAMRVEHGLTKECPRCKGHGGWNLALNQYPLPQGKENTAANRHTFVHFRASCSHCNGWRYVRETENCPGHEWQHVRNTGNCLNLYRCAVCGKEWEIDSSG